MRVYFLYNGPTIAFAGTVCMCMYSGYVKVFKREIHAKSKQFQDCAEQTQHNLLKRKAWGEMIRHRNSGCSGLGTWWKYILWA